MGLVKIDDELHEQARTASAVMCRSINAQAEFWMKIGRLAEANPVSGALRFELPEGRYASPTGRQNGSSRPPRVLKRRGRPANIRHQGGKR